MQRSHISKKAYFDLKLEVAIYERRRDAIEIEDEASIANFYQLQKQIEVHKLVRRDILNQPTYCLPFLQPGRVVGIRQKVGDEDLDFGWGILLNFNKTFQKAKNGVLTPVETGPVYVLDVLLHCLPGTDANKLSPRPALKGQSGGELLVVPCSLDAINGLSSIRVNVPKEVKSVESRKQLLKILFEIDKRFKDGVPMLDPVKDLCIKDVEFTKLVEKIGILESKLKGTSIYSSGEVQEKLELYNSKVALNLQINACQKEIARAEAVLQLDELKNRRRVLRRLEYVSPADIIETKGRVACEISSGDELLLTEMIFNGLFNDLTVEQTVALLSCFTCDEKVNFLFNVEQR